MEKRLRHNVISGNIWGRFGIGLVCLLLSVGMVGCDSLKDDDGDGDTGEFDSATLNQAAAVGGTIMSVATETLTSVYQAILLNPGGKAKSSTEIPFTCSDMGGGVANGTFGYDGSVANWDFDLALSNCNGVSGFLNVVGASLPGSNLGLDTELNGRVTNAGCNVDMGEFDVTMSGITLSDPPTASDMRWDGFLQIHCGQPTYIGCEFFNDPAGNASQIRSAIIERCSPFDSEFG